jgi:hypothetical protein
MAAYEYTLKVGVQAASSTTLRTTKPVTERLTIVDLYNGLSVGDFFDLIA